MDAEKYCKEVEDKDRWINEQLPKMKIVDDGSDLVSLKDNSQYLLFEPSMNENYRYLVRELVAEKILQIAKLLDQQNKTLIIRSVWRSYKHQKMIWENKFSFIKRIHPEKSINEIEVLVSNFIALPKESMHSTGGAVDALIFDKEDIKVMDFGTNNGLNIDLGEKCYPYHPEISDLAKKNRQLLIHLFEQEGFVVDNMEYWHFDYGNSIWAIEKKMDHAFYGPIGEL